MKEKPQPIPNPEEEERVNILKMSLDEFMNEVRNTGEFTDIELEILKTSNELEFDSKITNDGILKEVFQLLKKLELKNKLLEYEKYELMQELNASRDKVLTIQQEDGEEPDIPVSKDVQKNDADSTNIDTQSEKLKKFNDKEIQVNIPLLKHTENETLAKSQVEITIVNETNDEYILRFSELTKKIENEKQIFKNYNNDGNDLQNSNQTQVCSIS